MSRLVRSTPLWAVVASTALYGWLIVPHWHPTWDSATYITLARSLVSGEGYAYLGSPHIKYPPGFPLLLTPIVLLFGKNYLLMRALIVACAVGSVGVSVALFRRISATGVALTVAAMTVTCFAMFFEASRILSDLPYMAISLAALLLMERYRDEPTRRRFIVAMTAIVAAYSVRIVGMMLAPAFALSLLINAPENTRRERAKRAAVVLGVMAVVVGAWMTRNALVKQSLPPNLWEAATYERELLVTNATDPNAPTVGFGLLVSRVKKNIVRYGKLTASVLSAKEAKETTAMVLLVALMVVGWIIALLRRRGAVEYYSFLYGVVFILWPANQGERFLVPVLPMVFYYALTPLVALIDALTSRFQTVKGDVFARTFRSIARLFLLVALALGAALSNRPHLAERFRAERRDPYYQGEMADYIAAFRWVGENAPRDAVIITNRAPYGVLIADRPTYTVPRVTDAAAKWESIERVGGTHVIANSYTKAHLGPLISANPERFSEKRRIGSTLIYEINERRDP